MRRLLALLVLAPLSAGCSHDHDHEQGGDHGSGQTEGHAHTAPHGGTLVELSEEFAHVELVLDRERGELVAYSLGAHAERPVRLAQPSIVVACDAQGADEAFRIELLAVSSGLTGETVGDTSQFQAADPRLSATDALTGVLERVDSRGQRFERVPFTIP